MKHGESFQLSGRIAFAMMSDLERFANCVGRVNENEWRGHAAGAVLCVMCHVTSPVNAPSTRDVTMRFHAPRDRSGWEVNTHAVYERAAFAGISAWLSPDDDCLMDLH